MAALSTNHSDICSSSSSRKSSEIKAYVSDTGFQSKIVGPDDKTSAAINKDVPSFEELVSEYETVNAGTYIYQQDSSLYPSVTPSDTTLSYLNVHNEEVHDGKFNHYILHSDTLLCPPQLTSDNPQLKKEEAKSYICSYKGCNKKLTCKNSLKSHKLTHTGEKPYCCKTCNKKFRTRSDLTKHSRTHTGETPYICHINTCGKGFKTKSQLNAHLNIHYKKKPYKCLDCDKAFSNHRNLINHKRTHTGERPYRCDYPGCLKSFSEYSTLFKHKRVHNKLKCSHCNKEFRTEQARTNHTNKNHQNDINTSTPVLQKQLPGCKTIAINDHNSPKTVNSTSQDNRLTKINIKSTYDKTCIPDFSFNQQISSNADREMLNKCIPNNKNRKTFQIGSMMAYLDKKLSENKLKHETTNIYKNTSFNIFDEEKKKAQLVYTST